MAASSTDTAWALRFISGKYQGGEFPLKMSRQVTIGRSSELDMVLVEDMVSRKHAKITVGPGKVLIEDLGSTNGTFVNGEKIRQARLKEGDRILIGTSILQLVQREAGTTRSGRRKASTGSSPGRRGTSSCSRPTARSSWSSWTAPPRRC